MGPWEVPLLQEEVVEVAARDLMQMRFARGRWRELLQVVVQQQAVAAIAPLVLA